MPLIDGITGAGQADATSITVSYTFQSWSLNRFLAVFLCYSHETNGLTFDPILNVQYDGLNVTFENVTSSGGVNPQARARSFRRHQDSGLPLSGDVVATFSVPMHVVMFVAGLRGIDRIGGPLGDEDVSSQIEEAGPGDATISLSNADYGSLAAFGFNTDVMLRSYVTLTPYAAFPIRRQHDAGNVRAALCSAAPTVGSIDVNLAYSPGCNWAATGHSYWAGIAEGTPPPLLGESTAPLPGSPPRRLARWRPPFGPRARRAEEDKE